MNLNPNEPDQNDFVEDSRSSARERRTHVTGRPVGPVSEKLLAHQREWAYAIMREAEAGVTRDNPIVVENLTHLAGVVNARITKEK
jgi:hypothetical protein